MIYKTVPPTAPIRQGDIFRGIPRIEAKLTELPVVVADDQILVGDWLQILAEDQAIQAVVGVRPVLGIVITQDCDAVRADDIALAEITEFVNVEPNARSAKKPASIVGLVTKHARLNQKWFYLPPDPMITFSERMGVDFQTVLRTSRSYLEASREQLRLGRLNDVASEHFRERLSEFCRRYPYDEWYPLNKEEFDEYKRQKPPGEPFPWQK